MRDETPTPTPCLLPGIREIRGGDLPWGGLQLVVRPTATVCRPVLTSHHGQLCGDFAQLPPVQTRPSPGQPPDAFLNRGFAFQAPIWNGSNVQEIMLTKVFRQSDEEFVRILNDIREGRGQAAMAALQRRCLRPLPQVHGIKPTELYSRNSDVDSVNARELEGICDELLVYPSCDSTITKEEEKLDESGGDRSNEATVRLQRDLVRVLFALNPEV